jgi:hypothetical protein
VKEKKNPNGYTNFYILVVYTNFTRHSKVKSKHNFYIFLTQASGMYNSFVIKIKIHIQNTF